VIEFKKLNIGYSFPVAYINIQELNLSKVYAIIGSNGSGKSTFMKTISGQIKPFSGEYSIQGKSYEKWNQKQRAKTISFVPTIFPLNDFMSAYQFVALGRTPYLQSLAQLNTYDQQIVDETFELLQINHLKKVYTKQLSDGQRQLCALARALTQQTPIILLDEPTNFLDYKNKRKIISLLVEIAQKKKRCIVFSSHDIETIFAYNEIELIGINMQKTTGIVERIDKKKTFEQIIEQYYR